MVFVVFLACALSASVDSTTMRREETVDADHVEKRREEEDRRVFKVADSDGNGFLQTHEVAELLGQTSLPSDFDWRMFDKDKDGALSESEFVASGPAAADAALQVAPHPSSLLEVGTSRHDDSDEAQFAAADADGSGFLEKNEVLTLMQTLGFGDGLDWHPLDRDADGRLSFAELVAAANAHGAQDPAGFIEVKDASNAAMETDDADRKKTGEAEDRKIFQQFDANGNNFLEPGEIEDLLEKAGLNDRSFDWWPFDVDKDGLLSEKEFLSAGPAALEALGPAMQVFKHVDSDGSSLLEADEVDAFQKRVGIKPGAVDWAAFDQDGDDRLSKAEFRAAGQAVDAAIPSEPASSLQEMDVASQGRPRRDQGEKGGKEPEADPEQAFNQADKNKSGYLEKHEVERILKGPDTSHVNWKNYDKDGDGKLSKKEFLALYKAVNSDSKRADSDSK